MIMSESEKLKAQKKFFKAYRITGFNEERNRVNANLVSKIAVNNYHTIALVSPYLKDLTEGQERVKDAIKSIPVFKLKKTSSIMDINYISEQIDILKAMGFQRVLVKMSMEHGWPIEFVGIEDEDRPPKNPTRIFIAPVISDDIDMKKWIKYECRRRIERKAKIDAPKETKPEDAPTQTA